MSSHRIALVLLALAACSRPTASTGSTRDSGAPPRVAPSAPPTAWLEDGDLVFQTSRSAQSQAIQLATHSKFSHVGIVYHGPHGAMVFEAIGPVTSTPLAAWIARGEGGHWTAKRLVDRSVLTPATLAKMRKVGERFVGKPYDFAFGWSDDALYCSELVWKIFHEGAGIDLAPLAKLGDFDLSSPVVKQKLAERYGAKIPLEEIVVSPSALADSSLVATVAEDAPQIR